MRPCVLARWFFAACSPLAAAAPSHAAPACVVTPGIQQQITVALPATLAPELTVVNWVMLPEAAGEDQPRDVAGQPVPALEPFPLASGAGRALELHRDPWQSDELRVEARDTITGATLCSSHIEIKKDGTVDAAFAPSIRDLLELPNGAGEKAELNEPMMAPGAGGGKLSKAPARGKAKPGEPPIIQHATVALPTTVDVKVYFATERRLEPQPNGTVIFTSDRSGEAEPRHGYVMVHLPRELLDAAAARKAALPLPDNFRAIQVRPALLSGSDFYNALKTDLLTRADKNLLIYVHGFNNGFMEEAYKLAMLTYESNYGGIPILFDWPAIDVPFWQLPKLVAGYGIDVAMVTNTDLSQRHLQTLLDLLRQRELGAQHISLLAHSLGSRLLLRTLDGMQRGGGFVNPALQNFDQMILAAPDVAVTAESPDAQFAGMLKPLLQANAFRRVSMYGARNDRAMWVSYLVNHHQPRGYIGDIETLSGFDQLIVTAINEGFIGHDYFVTNRQVVDDIGALLNHGTGPPRKLSPLGGAYSVFVFQP